MREKIKSNFFRMRDKSAERIKNALLACFSAVAPVWNFLFLKRQVPNSGQPVSSSLHDTKSLGYSKGLYRHQLKIIILLLKFYTVVTVPSPEKSADSLQET